MPSYITIFLAILKVKGIGCSVVKNIVTIVIYLLTKYVKLFDMYNLYFHDKNDLAMVRHISGDYTIFMYKRPYLLTSKMADLWLFMWLQVS